MSYISRGYIECFQEIKAQWKAFSDCSSQNAPSDIVVASGSGGTIAGLCIASYLNNCSTRIHAIAVCDDAEYFTNHVKEIFAAHGFPPEDVPKVLNSVETYRGIGYALSTERELDLISQVARDTGIITDPVYSGKAVVGMMDLICNHPHVFMGQDILFIHTGGLFGFFTSDRLFQLEKLLPRNEVTVLCNSPEL